MRTRSLTKIATSEVESIAEEATDIHDLPFDPVEMNIECRREVEGDRKTEADTEVCADTFTTAANKIVSSG